MDTTWHFNSWHNVKQIRIMKLEHFIPLDEIHVHCSKAMGSCTWYVKDEGNDCIKHKFSHTAFCVTLIIFHWKEQWYHLHDFVFFTIIYTRWKKEKKVTDLLSLFVWKYNIGICLLTNKLTVCGEIVQSFLFKRYDVL